LSSLGSSSRGAIPLLERVEAALSDAGLLQRPGCALVAAVSGGPDSMALLGALRALREKHSIQVHAAHLNHGLRGAEGDEDARFVRETCWDWGIPCTLEKADVAGLRARERLSWEAAARQARYNFLARVASAVGASAVALGHTADDQVETVLLHLIRGTGIRGLRGMLPLSRWRGRNGVADVTLVRPLLQATRKETEAYCASLGLSPRYDSSNLEDRFTRNRIRRNMMPQLRKYNPSVDQALLRLATTVAEDVAYIDQQVQEVWPSLASKEPWGVRLRRDAFSGLHPSLKAHVLWRTFVEVAGEATDLSLAQIEAMRQMAERGAGRAISLGGGIRFHTTYQDLLMGREPPKVPWPPLTEAFELPVPGIVCAEGWRAEARLLDASETDGKLAGADSLHAYLDVDTVGQELLVRNRKPGDRFHPLGLQAEKKLKEFMIDAHIPRAWRDSVPLVVGKQGIAWVVGWRIAHWARVTPETRRVVEIRFSSEGSQQSA